MKCIKHVNKLIGQVIDLEAKKNKLLEDLESSHLVVSKEMK